MPSRLNVPFDRYLEVRLCRNRFMRPERGPDRMVSWIEVE
jgi:hypothetical protein